MGLVLTFWAALFLGFWAYLGYPAFVRVLGRWLPAPDRSPWPLGRSVLLVAAYNEDAVIDDRIHNALSLEEDGDLLVVIVSDGSTDGTDEIVERWSEKDARVRLIRVRERRGKNHALNVALEQLRLAPEDVVVFTDANVTFHRSAVVELRRALRDGAACAIGKLTFVGGTSGTARAEGLYWRYENALKEAEGRWGRSSVANGAILAVRAGDVPHLPPDVGNDFWIPLIFLAERKGVVCAPDARAFEPAPQGRGEEFRRKVRMANRQMRGILRAWRRLDTATRFQVVSHKALRWFGLVWLVLALASAAALWDRPLYRAATVVLAAPALLALLGIAGRRIGVSVPLADTAIHFFVVQIGALRGAVEALGGRRRATWDLVESARRTVA